MREVKNVGHSRFYRVRLALEAYEPQGLWARAGWEFLLFGFKQGWACLFGGLMLVLLLVTKFVWSAEWPVARYDFMFGAALFIQLALLLLRMETLAEAKVIVVFHLVGTVMELFKTHAGSWNYPEASVMRIGDVPLFSGFMYAAVGSYIARITRIFDMRYSHYPKLWQSGGLAAAIYGNFFAHHFMADLRNALFLLLGAVYGRCWVHFRPHKTWRKMPLLLGFGLVAFFIWIGENIGTFAAAWYYPHQAHGWQMVSVGKLGAWYLLMLISFVLVSLVHQPQEPELQKEEEQAR
jgi:uncharacterized membrane protein YoaT (DUF817 family)